MGITNIILGVRYNLPLPVQPQKTIGTVALSRKWTSNRVISTGFATGIIWFILGSTKFLDKITEKVPQIVVRGIQLGLSFILGWTAIFMFLNNYILGLISILIILIFIKYENVPTAILLVFLGIFVLIFTFDFPIKHLIFNLPSISLYLPTIENMLLGMITAGIGQLLLTLTNVMVASIALIKKLFPEKQSDINSNNLASNMGIINLFSPFLGGIPLCHGSGGLAAQYAFGARTGGSMIFEGIIEIVLGLFFSNFLFTLFIVFPEAILGAMLMYTAFMLGKVSLTEVKRNHLPIIIISALFCFLINITIGFIVGVILYLIYNRLAGN